MHHVQTPQGYTLMNITDLPAKNSATINSLRDGTSIFKKSTTVTALFI